MWSQFNLKAIIQIATIILISTGSHAQSLYRPRNVKVAFENGTRSMNGNPGPHYWQNLSNYDISLTVAPPDRTIKGSEEITYFNESPDTLKTITFRLLKNFFMPEAIHFISMDSSVLTSGVHIDKFAINGVVSSWQAPSDHFTWQDVDLAHPLLPGDTIRFSIQWHFDISSVFNGPDRTKRSAVLRSGMADSTTWSVAYFYPRIAVYDDVTAWDKLEFTGAQEFYNDFNNYILKINAPANYIVWATGTLQNPDEVLQPHYAQLLKKSMTSDEVIHIATPDNLKRKNITTQTKTNTWIWKANDVTDVALFISDHYNWDATSVIVDKNTGRRSSVQAAYNDASPGFHQLATIGQNALSQLSQNLPGTPYPYPKMTVVEGFSGMEYPMMANVGLNIAEEKIASETNHEIAHTYFPFYMGIDESRYGFMDEGWATFFTEVMETRMPVMKRQLASWTKLWLGNLTQRSQLPVASIAIQPLEIPYLSNAYVKPALAYLALKELLGDQLFKKCLQGYIARWHGKHPIPWDFFNVFNNISGKNLNWFWNSWFFSHGYDDLGIEKVVKTPTGYSVTIKNVGGFDIPFDLKINYADGSKENIHKSPVVWKDNPEHILVNVKTNRKISSLTIDNGIWMDASEKDNVWRESNLK
ncbi:MAG: M1 family metallopeptidase [Chitinophagaceae bacterium]|nr:M1 family metallopeptidase [Chitinophagaceae bacterium]